MNRKFSHCIIITLIIFGSLLFSVYGCGSTSTPVSPSVTSTPSDITGIQPGDLLITSSVSEGHTHVVDIKYYDIETPPSSDTFTTSKAGVGPHTHTVRLTKPQFQDIKAGKTVTVLSSVALEYNHTHTFVIKK